MSTGTYNLAASRKSGTALVVVMCTILLLSSILAVLSYYTGTHMKITRAQEDLEKSFFVAEAGLERAGQYLAGGGSVPATLCGNVGDGSYVSMIISGASITDAWHSVGGQININPNNSPQSEFSVTLPDGTTITRDTLTTNYPGFIGQITLVHFKPKGNDHQNNFFVDGVAYDIDNNKTYDIVSDYMSISIYNDNVNSNGVAMGKWWFSVAAAEADLVVDGVGSGTGNNGQARIQYSILSVGTVRGQVKVVLRETVKQKTWAKFALWMTQNNGIYFKAGEKFYGSVYSTEQLSFSGDPEFFGDLQSAAATYAGSTNACIFHNGFQLGVSNQTMQSVSFTNLYSKSNLKLEGNTYITFATTNMLITNARMGWTNKIVNCSTDNTIYVSTATTGTSGTRPGDVYVGGTLDGRATIICERDFLITNHVAYAVDPTTNMLSNDALGMIAKRDIVVTTSAPNNLKIHAHMMATGQYDTNSTSDGSFGVENYDTRAASGNLTVVGGIVQYDRGAVGTFNSGTGALISGFNKNYTYDTRFENDPPPNYPPLSDDLIFGYWRER